MDIDGMLERVRRYVNENLAYEIILGDLRIRVYAIVYDARRRSTQFGLTNLDQDTKLFAASISNIYKALQVKINRRLKNLRLFCHQGFAITHST
ncbi:Bgt-20351 [Blumeria graminis f. sp. tritici]|uniref:Bgt-20351 n=2 Tax=Blumeria graminis f. sp. tritici TaxID=62690 RepID=A0A9X9LBN3_BLUGR|nr:Bgt-20351 [Blumeria graminis f. sp. tritici]